MAEKNLYGDIQEPIEDTLEFQRIITEESIKEASQILQKYKSGKANLERRIVEDELWWELRHWEVIRNKNEGDVSPEPSSAWLFNSILNKHADAMDNFPIPTVLPRERSDEESAKILSSIIPVIMEHNEFEQVYSDNWWEKLKHGTAVYGVFWNNERDNGIGDIDIKPIDLLNIFFEPGIRNIQDSRNVFTTQLVDIDILDEMYPEHKGKFGKGDVNVTEYVYDDTVDTTEKAVVVDWYYKTNQDGQTRVHYVKYVNDVILWASENEPEYIDRGIYDHAMYPFVLDTLFPEKGTPIGFGYVSICKEPQLYIDKLSANIMENSVMATKKRFFVSSSTGINEDEFTDWSKPLVHVEGEISDARIQEIITQPLPPIYQNVLQSKIEEMKDTSANRDVNSGGTGSGITAAAAISALQEAGNKASRDMLTASYRAYTNIVRMVIELMRQFYDETRTFRITGEIPGHYEFIDVSNSQIKPQLSGIDDVGNDMFRTPIFDLKIKAMKKNPFSRMEENERAKELYAMGFFNPEKAQESLLALEMMDFEGIDKVKEQVSKGQTMLNLLQQMSQQLEMMSGMMGINPMPQGPTEETAPKEDDTVTGKNTNVTDTIMASREPQTGYQQRLVKRSSPSME